MRLNFLTPHAESIELALADARPGGWRRARQQEFERLPKGSSWQAAWRVDLPRNQLAIGCVDHAYLVLDADFPLSEPRIIAPQAAPGKAPAWPHVEAGGLLCLSTTQFTDAAGRRAVTVLQDAYDVLDLDEVARTAEFRREFISYWSQRVNASASDGLALLRGDGVDRDIFFHAGRKETLVFADTEDELEHWLKNNGASYQRPFSRTRLAWPEALQGPDSYPRLGRDVIDLVGQEHLEGRFPLGGKLPVVLGRQLEKGAVFAGAVLVGPSRDFLSRGFRPSRQRPQRYLAEGFKARAIEAMSIERVDAPWVHGRDANTMLGRMQACSIGIVGCGAIGGYLARVLAQGGVGSLVLVDHDRLKAANLGRHVLGAEWIGRLKATALSEQLARDFPHAARPIAFGSRFQDLKAAELEALSRCDVVVLAGVDLPAELAVDRWIETTENPPVRVWTWTEEFAHAGQAVALFGGDRIRDGLDQEGKFQLRATKNWDRQITSLGEVGCGTSFQPYSVADMMHTVLMAQRLVTDIVLGKVDASDRRTWFGDREAVVALGAEPSAEFDRSFMERRFPWRD